MDSVNQETLQLGILGGGQLGKMLIEEASDWNIHCHVLDPDPECSCAQLTRDFTCGSFRDFDTVYNFGKDLHTITIEIEHVNTDALRKLQQEGKSVYPDPEVLSVIQDKGRQKSFYAAKKLPTVDFYLHENLAAVRHALGAGKLQYPFVLKVCKAGYDGKGVQVVRSEEDLSTLPDVPVVAETHADIVKELSVIAARDHAGTLRCFPAVEMEFHPGANLVDLLFAPADIDTQTEQRARDLAADTIRAFDMTGILAVEMFLTRDGSLLINEVAPRPHNSGHHTIEANRTSQYGQLLRILFGMPLGDTALRSPALMLNILGEPGYSGPARYIGMREVLAIEDVYLHLYGKKVTKPLRKMGHVTILDGDRNRAREKAGFIKRTLKIIA